jgi:hypothetical protein
MSTKLKDAKSSIWKQTVKALDAQYQLTHPFYKRTNWPKKALTSISKQIETRINSKEFKEDCKHQTRVFYLERYFERALTSLSESSEYKVSNCQQWIRRLLTHVPLVYVNQGELQNGAYFNSWQDKVLQQGREKYKLLTDEERVLSRRKVIATPCEIYARGGYPQNTNGQVHLLSEPQRCIMLSVLGAQFDSPGLDLTYFVSELKGKQIVNQRLLLLSTIHDVYLWLSSFDQMLEACGDERKGFLKFSRVGCGFFARLFPHKTDIGKMIEQHLVWALQFVTSHCKFKHIAAIQCLFF